MSAAGNLRENDALFVEGLGVHYGAHTALDDVSIRASAGELIAVIGPNGAGKTTFIKALSGQVPHKGTIAIHGTTLTKGADRRAHIGLVPQDIGLYPHLTARENLAVMARMMGVARADVKAVVGEALHAVGLIARADDPLTTLSGGMKRRINVAAAIMHKPRILIFDEPTAGVDISARDVVHTLARKMAERGLVVLLITHELEQAEVLADRILLLQNGRMLADLPPEALLLQHFGHQREVLVRFTTPPDERTLKAMREFGFTQAHHQTVYATRTQSDEASFTRAFSAAMRNFEDSVREITVRRPGLETLLHDLAKPDERAVSPEAAP